MMINTNASFPPSLFLTPLAERRLDALIAKRAEKTPDDLFLIFPQEHLQLTFAELFAAGRRYAGFFAGAGLLPGDHIALMMPNCSAWVKAWFGTLLAGLVDVGIHHELGGLMLAHQLRVAKVAAIVCETDALNRILDAVGRSEGLSLRMIVVEGTTSLDTRERVQATGLNMHELAEAPHAAALVPVARMPQEVMSIRFTSGTTGPAKAATLTMSQVAVWTGYLVQLLGFEARDRIYAPFPLHHHLASVMGVMGALTAGGGCIVDHQFSASRFWSTAIACGATLGLILDPVVKMLLGLPPSDLDRAHSIRRFYVARPNPAFESRFGTELQSAYALTEGSVLAFVPPGHKIALPNCVGYVNPHFDIRVVDENDEEVPPGSRGEIVFRPMSPGLCMCSYFDDPAETLKALRNYWFHTGDLGEKDEAGRLFFLERMGDTIRRKGVNIPSFHIEETAAAFPGVHEAAAVSVPSALGEFEVKLCITETEKGAVNAEALIRWMAEQLPTEMVPRLLEIRDSFERTNTHKIIKQVLKKEGVTRHTIPTDAWLRK